MQKISGCRCKQADLRHGVAIRDAGNREWGWGMGVADASFEELLGLIYESVHDTRLLVPVMQKICTGIGAAAGHYVRMDLDCGAVSSSLITHESYAGGEAEYAAYYSRIDPRLAWLNAGEAGEWRLDQTRFDETFIRDSEFYNDFLGRNGVRHIAACHLGGGGKEREVLGFLRHADAPFYQEEHVQFLQRLSPHLNRAAALRGKLQQQNLLLQQERVLVENLAANVGIVYLSAAGKLVSMNAAASALLSAGDGIGILRDSLVAREPDDRDNLARLLQGALSASAPRASWMRLRRTSGVLTVSAIPFGTRDSLDATENSAAAAILMEHSITPKLPPTNMLQATFKLTQAEAKLAVALLQEETLQSYSEKQGISRNTARTHLASLFAKTGVRRQPDLMRLLLATQPGPLVPVSSDFIA
ncbi:helix-turn-helix transcriptional regulator [Herbaspirillum lusitanum]|uniref:Helix-turn-helix transcriptional regulator n=1 Tax=Herbaspirillum lusitanum TaxID=213312 RepID=A0ABW9A8R6_9BURK